MEMLTAALVTALGIGAGVLAGRVLLATLLAAMRPGRH
jgi:hypothetical protein